jgi:hypothetical protein
MDEIKIKIKFNANIINNKNEELKTLKIELQNIEVEIEQTKFKNVEKNDFLQTKVLHENDVCAAECEVFKIK